MHKCLNIFIIFLLKSVSSLSFLHSNHIFTSKNVSNGKRNVRNEERLAEKIFASVLDICSSFALKWPLPLSWLGSIHFVYFCNTLDFSDQIESHLAWMILYYSNLCSISYNVHIFLISKFMMHKFNIRHFVLQDEKTQIVIYGDFS